MNLIMLPYYVTHLKWLYACMQLNEKSISTSK